MAKGLNIVGILVLLVGAFLVLDGIDTISGNSQGFSDYSPNWSKVFGGNSDTMNIVFGVIELLAGGLLIASRFMSLGSLDGILRIAILIFWILYILLGLILGGRIKNIDSLSWWSALVNNLIILVILWLIKE